MNVSVKAATAVSVAIIMTFSTSCTKEDGGDGSRKVTIEDLHNRFWTTQYAQFFKDSTWMIEAESDGHIRYDPQTGEPVSIPVYDYATQLAMDYNTANPDNLVTPEDAMFFDFTADYDGNRHFHEFSFREDGYFVLLSGSTTANGYMVTSLEISGKYVFDETKQEISVDDRHSTSAEYYRQLRVPTKMVKDELHLRIIELSDSTEGNIPKGDMLLFRLSNYDGSQTYYPFGKIVYVCKEIDESISDMDYHPSADAEQTTH